MQTCAPQVRRGSDWSEWGRGRCEAASPYARDDNQSCGLWRAGRPAAGATDRRDGYAGEHGSELATFVWAGDAERKRALPCDPGARSHWIAGDYAAGSGGRDE